MRWRGMCVIGPKQSSKVQVSYMKKRLKCLWSSLLSPSLHSWPHGEFPKISWQRKKTCGHCLQMVPYNMKTPPRSGQLQPCSISLGHSRRTVIKGNPLSGQELQAGGLMHLEVHSSCKSRHTIIHQFLGDGQWLDGQGLGCHMTRKLVVRSE